MLTGKDPELPPGLDAPEPGLPGHYVDNLVDVASAFWFVDRAD